MFCSTTTSIVWPQTNGSHNYTLVSLDYVLSSFLFSHSLKPLSPVNVTKNTFRHHLTTLYIVFTYFITFLPMQCKRAFMYDIWWIINRFFVLLPVSIQCFLFVAFDHCYFDFMFLLCWVRICCWWNGSFAVSVMRSGRKHAFRRWRRRRRKCLLFC